MANINNFSLVGVGSSVKLGKGGIVLDHASSKLRVGNGTTQANVALESFVTSAITALNLGTMSTETAADYTPTAGLNAAVGGYGYLKIGDISGTYVDTTELSTALSAYTTTATLDTTVGGYGYLKIGDISGTYVDTTELSTALNAYTTTAELTAYGITDGGSLNTDVTALDFVKSDTTALDNYTTTTALTTALAGKLSLTGGTMTGAITLSGAPSDPLHAATKGYVDGVSAGLSFKQSVIVATTANIALDDTTTVLDGVTLITGMRVLVKNQTDKTKNGIYIVNTSGAWARSSDADEPGELVGGTFVFVTSGTAQADTGFVVVAPNGTAVIGTDDIVWSQYSSTGTVSVTAGTGIGVTSSNGAYTVTLENTAVTPGNYGSASSVATFTVDAQGRLTAAGTTPIAIAWSAITSGNPTTLSGYGITDAVSTVTAFGGDVSGTYNNIVLANSGVTAGTYTKVTVDAKGRVTVGASANATDIVFTPAGDIAATDVAGALAELDTDKLAKAGGTMSGAIAMGTNKITGLGDPTAAQDAATKKYVDDTLSAAVAGGNFTVSSAFTEGTSPVQLLSNILVGATINRIVVKVTSASAGTPILSVTRGGQTLENGAGSDLAVTGTYIIDSYEDVAASGSLDFAITTSLGC